MLPYSYLSVDMYNFDTVAPDLVVQFKMELNVMTMTEDSFVAFFIADFVLFVNLKV